MANEYVLIRKNQYDSMEKEISGKDTLHMDPSQSNSDNGQESNDPTSISSDNHIDSNGTESQDKLKNASIDDVNSAADESESDESDSMGKLQEIRYDYSDIIHSFDKLDLHYIRPIINGIMNRNKPEILTWRQDSGEIIFRNSTVKDSNITMLLTHTLIPIPNVTGVREFYTGLVNLELPDYLVKSYDGRMMMREVAMQRNSTDTKLNNSKKEIKKQKYSEINKAEVKASSKKKKLQPIMKTKFKIHDPHESVEWLRW